MGSLYFHEDEMWVKELLEPQGSNFHYFWDISKKIPLGLSNPELS